MKTTFVSAFSIQRLSIDLDPEDLPTVFILPNGNAFHVPAPGELRQITVKEALTLLRAPARRVVKRRAGTSR